METEAFSSSRRSACSKLPKTAAESPNELLRGSCIGKALYLWLNHQHPGSGQIPCVSDLKLLGLLHSWVHLYWRVNANTHCTASGCERRHTFSYPCSFQLMLCHEASVNIWMFYCLADVLTFERVNVLVFRGRGVHSSCFRKDLYFEFYSEVSRHFKLIQGSWTCIMGELGVLSFSLYQM